MNHKVSRYQVIWETIKTTGKCELVADVTNHARLIKAVIKRKDEDLGYKLQLSELGKRAKLVVKTDENNECKLIFTLNKSIGLDDL